MPKRETFDRQQVLQDVMLLFWQKGYHGTSMQDIVDVTGLNRSSLYNSFGDKYELFNAALRSYFENQYKAFHDLLEKPPKIALRAMFRLEDFQPNCWGSFQAKVASELAASDKHIYRRLHSHMGDTITILEQILEKGKKDGSFRSAINVRQVARYIYSSIQGQYAASILHRSEGERDKFIDQLIEQL